MATRMRIAETPFLYDWFVITLRWLIILVMTVMMAFTGRFVPAAGLALLVLAAWNVYVSLLAILNRRLPYHRQANLAVDWSATLVVFFASSGQHGPTLWPGLLAMLPAGIYFGLRGSLLAAGFFSLVLIGWIIPNLFRLDYSRLTALPFLQMAVYAGQILVVNLALGALFGAISSQVIRALRVIYTSQVQAAIEEERRVQKAEHDRMQAFYHLLETLSDTLNFKVVLDTALKLGVTALDAPGALAGKMVGAVLLLGDGGLRMGAAIGFEPADMAQTFPAELGELREMVQTGERRVLTDPAQDPELGRLTALADCASALALPMRRGLSSFGVILFAHPAADFFTEERVEILETISHQAAIGFQNARQYQDSEKGKARMLQVEEDARKQLARELHDGPAQSVSAVAMGIDMARHMLKTDPAKAENELSRVEDLARRTSQEIRHMLFTMRPLVLESDGLVAALQAMADKMRDTYQQNVRVEADPAVERSLDASRQTVVFYLADEAVNNARKHARAGQIDVRLHFLARDRGAACLEVTDDGQGFDVERVNSAYERRDSMGMINLRERTKLIGGELTIASAPGKGTCVKVLIPLNVRVDEAEEILVAPAAKI